MKPVLNVIGDVFAGFVDKYLVHIPDDKKQAFLDHAEDLAVKAVEAGAKGAVEGGVDGLKKG